MSISFDHNTFDIPFTVDLSRLTDILVDQSPSELVWEWGQDAATSARIVVIRRRGSQGTVLATVFADKVELAVASMTKETAAIMFFVGLASKVKKNATTAVPPPAAIPSGPFDMWMVRSDLRAGGYDIRIANGEGGRAPVIEAITVLKCGSMQREDDPMAVITAASVIRWSMDVDQQYHLGRIAKTLECAHKRWEEKQEPPNPVVAWTNAIDLHETVARLAAAPENAHLLIDNHNNSYLLKIKTKYNGPICSIDTVNGLVTVGVMNQNTAELMAIVLPCIAWTKR